jgi:restriction system protein
MAFTLPKNSLFAVLLRSRWWVSLSVGVVLGLVATALLPETYRAVGPLTGTPFFVIAALAAWRQRHAPSAAELSRTQEALTRAAWPAFADALQAAFERDGWQVSRGTREPVDFVLERRGRQMVVAARRWKSARVGLEALRALQAAREAAEAPDALLIALGELTDTARPFAAQHRIAVWQAGEIAQALRGRLPA